MNNQSSNNEAINYGDYIHSNLKKYHKTQTDLANELGVSQKTISRYISGENKPSKYNIIMINSYFKRLEKSSLNLGERYANESDFNAHSSSINKFMLYTSDAQKFILKHMPAILVITDAEFILQDVFSQLTKDRQSQVISYLEQKHVSLDMITSNNSSSNRVPLFDQYSMYMQTLHSFSPYEGQVYAIINTETKEPPVATEKRLFDRFTNMCSKLKLSCDYSKDSLLYAKFNTAIKFTLMDWYFLFLLCRVRMSEHTNSDSTVQFKLSNKVSASGSEYMIWQYMQALILD